VPDSRSHRGPHPEDRGLFKPGTQDLLRAAVYDFCWLLSRGYNDHSALKIVGDRYALAKRQRTAVSRVSCSDVALCERRAKLVQPEQIRGAVLNLDGFNLLTTIEAALSGGVVLGCRDASFRDLASVHGTWRRVSETARALELISRMIAALEPAECRWYLDRPVSNSGRLRALLLNHAASVQLPWTVELVNDPDQVLSQAEGIAVTSDSQIINRCKAWFNFGRLIVEEHIASAWIVDLGIDYAIES